VIPEGGSYFRKRISRAQHTVRGLAQPRLHITATVTPRYTRTLAAASEGACDNQHPAYEYGVYN